MDGSINRLINGRLYFLLFYLEWDPYSKVKSMLKYLKLQDLLQKFFDNCIRVGLSFTLGH